MSKKKVIKKKVAKKAPIKTTLDNEVEEMVKKILEEDGGVKVKKLDLTKKTFMANGKRYTILDRIPLSRYREYQKLSPRLTYGADFTTIFRNLRQAYETLNKMKFADSSVIIHNIMNGIKDVDDENREPAALLICALIIVRDDEDLGVYNEELCKEKIADWKKEGYEVDGFFQLALLSISGFRQTFAEYIAKEAEEKIVKESVEEKS